MGRQFFRSRTPLKRNNDVCEYLKCEMNEKDITNANILAKVLYEHGHRDVMYTPFVDYELNYLCSELCRRRINKLLLGLRFLDKQNAEQVPKRMS